MEDAHAAILDLDGAPPNPSNSSSRSSEQQPSTERLRFFAVYDGHGGSTVAKYSGDTIHFRLRSTPEYQNGDYVAALKRAFLATDEDLRSNPDFNNDPSGCTAVAALITPSGEILVANAGDSRSVLSVNGVAEPMSHDHKPVNRDENSRIVAAGGFVEFGRVNGNLALSRAIGDFEFKQNKDLSPEAQVVTANPDIISHQTTSEDEFLILACDGIWDVYSNQQVVDRVRRLIGERKSLKQVAEEMIDHCLAPDCEWGGVGCDNMTFMVVAILGDKTKEQWYDMICERLQRGEGYQTPSTFPDPFSRAARGEMGASTLHQTSLLAASNDDGPTPPSYQISEGRSEDGSSGNVSTVGSSLFSLAPGGIIEALSRVSNHSNLDPSRTGQVEDRSEQLDSSDHDHQAEPNTHLTSTESSNDLEPSLSNPDASKSSSDA